LFNTLKFIDKAARYSIIFLIKGIRPFLGPSNCKYPTTCTAYAEEILKERSFLPAIFIVTKRVLSCNPFMDPKL
jgi:putative component of membrane protein insertase Oxa1/YidC/SpoIIIJ protein YidD